MFANFANSLNFITIFAIFPNLNYFTGKFQYFATCLYVNYIDQVMELTFDIGGDLPLKALHGN